MNVVKQAGTSLKQNAKQTAKRVAQQLAREPIEILKSAASQVGVTPEAGHDQGNQSATPTEYPKPTGQTPEEKQKKVAQSQRLMQAYENELKEIEQKKQQEQIQEQQEEIAKQEQKEHYEVEKKQSILQIVSKKGRRMFGKVGLKREQTKTETRQPPSS